MEEIKESKISGFQKGDNVELTESYMEIMRQRGQAPEESYIYGQVAKIHNVRRAAGSFIHLIDQHGKTSQFYETQLKPYDGNPRKYIT
ncbi:MAG: hypothetical protein AABW50_05510 [Nanoarchaeota archaeon]